MCLIGVRDDDEKACSELIAKKILDARLWDAPDGKPWSKSVKDMDYEVLLVSQFTLYGSLKIKSRPDYHRAMSTEPAKAFYNDFVELVKKMYKSEKIFDGVFGAYMNVELQNDGPCTLIVDTDDYESAVKVIRERLEKEERSRGGIRVTDRCAQE
ncbi:hypothetical protein WA538_002722 [Blastocystis sp. DL]